MDKKVFSFDQLFEAILALPQRMESLERAIALRPQTPSSESDSELLTVESACSLLCIKKATLYSLVSRRVIPSYRQGRRLFFLRKELLEVITSGKRASRTEVSDRVISHVTQNSNGTRPKKTRVSS